MTKTPEQKQDCVASRMAVDWYIRLLTEEPAVAIKEAYQAGYQAARLNSEGVQAAKDSLLTQFQSLLSSYAETSFNPNHTAWQIFDKLKEQQAAKDRLADASKVIEPTDTKLIKPTDTVGKEELNCMITHFENEDYKISVLVPGILPKADGGELVCGCGLIVYDICKKVA